MHEKNEGNCGLRFNDIGNCGGFDDTSARAVMVGVVRTPFMIADVVRFSKRYSPGQIIVSFGDRRLYHVVRRGQAVSYPIAIPRAQSRWQGVLRVSQKRVNPSWTPTAQVCAARIRNSRASFLADIHVIHSVYVPSTSAVHSTASTERMRLGQLVRTFRKAVCACTMTTSSSCSSARGSARK